MSNLNPNIPSPELSGLMTTAAFRMAEFELKLLTPQLLLHTFLEASDSVAHQILSSSPRSAASTGLIWRAGSR
jgi:hypothetical protein